MTKKERAKWIFDVLKEYFPSPKVPLHYTSPYTLLVAVLLSAQCTDERVNKVTPALFALADTPRKMVELKVEEIAEVIHSLGLSVQKARAIHALSRILVDTYKGEVPADFKALEQLPGVGHKTASVVMSQAFNHPAFPVDTHIHRLAKRWGLSSGKNVEETERDLKKLFPKAEWSLLHLRMIYFARAFCRASGHDAASCPICSRIA